MASSCWPYRGTSGGAPGALVALLARGWARSGTVPAGAPPSRQYGRDGMGGMTTVVVTDSGAWYDAPADEHVRVVDIAIELASTDGVDSTIDPDLVRRAI